MLGTVPGRQIDNLLGNLDGIWAVFVRKIGFGGVTLGRDGGVVPDLVEIVAALAKALEDEVAIFDKAEVAELRDRELLKLLEGEFGLPVGEAGVEVERGVGGALDKMELEKNRK